MQQPQAAAMQPLNDAASPTARVGDTCVSRGRDVDSLAQRTQK